MRNFFLLVLTIFFIFLKMEKAQTQANYDESKVPDFNLPALLTSNDGQKISTVEDWKAIRRPEIYAQFESLVYGKVPNQKITTAFKVVEQSDQIMGGKVIRKQVKALFSKGDATSEMTILIYLPKHKDPVPMFVGLNFYGNHTIQSDPAILISDSWVQNNKEFYIENNKADERSRGMRAHRWPVSRIVGRGYGIATIYCGDIDPDFDDQHKNGVHALLENAPQEEDSESWGTISTWAWGLSRAMDYFKTDPKIDAAKVAVIGHSRLGKTSIWAGASDERFAMVISNNSGCGGAALSKRKFGETVARINTNFPHWFCKNFRQFNNKEEDLPIDQHMLLALVAPRPLYVASAQEDQWADPKGEYLSAYYAGVAYRLFKEKSFRSEELPEADQPRIVGKMGYHIRSGKHDITVFDWEQYLNFADLQF